MQYFIKIYQKKCTLKIKKFLNSFIFFIKIKGMIKGENKLIKDQLIRNKKLENELKNKNVIKIAFFVISDSVWKIDIFYKLLEKHKRFEPIIIICPWINLGKEKMEYEMNKTEKYFKEKEYKYLLTIRDGKYLDINKEVKPDIIFYTNPYEGLIDPRYYITKFPNILSCYIPYSFDTSNLFGTVYDLKFFNLLWKFFLPTKVHYGYSKKYSRIQGNNVKIIKYPELENFFLNFQKNNCIKNKKKIIIWAPHHTLEDAEVLKWSTFELYYNFMLEVSEKYKEKVVMIFKPHPILYSNLVKKWGKEKTDNYFNLWENSPYRKIELGRYVKLFLESDAMIHDCGSFTVEYLYFRKPVCRLTNRKNWKKELNSFGEEAWKCHDIAYSKEDIVEFIENVINNKDNKLHEKQVFYEKYLKIEEEERPSLEIIRELEKYI
ncbi:CDP-glycerol glycerophosphotransferase family protein [Fusobacterium varium]|uniref:CDP-glycerol glycerophosphotransferase family protein n=1 Tax=Fusobacterium varium TaxID=856 RepID=UPI003EFF6F08